MPVSRARVATQSGSRYLQQLCKHWSHRFDVDFSPLKGGVDFGGGETLLLAADEAGIDLRIDAQDAAADMAGLETVVEDHLRRFAFREDLIFAWDRS